MKLLILFISILTFNSFAKCRVAPLKEQFDKTPYFVEGVVYDANFSNGATIRKRSHQNTDEYPTYKIRVLRYLKGSSNHKELTVKNFHVSFGAKRFPRQLVGIRNGKKMIFRVSKIKDNGEAIAYTGACSHRFTEIEVKKFL
jgi:hypothetical protein